MFGEHSGPIRLSEDDGEIEGIDSGVLENSQGLVVVHWKPLKKSATNNFRFGSNQSFSIRFFRDMNCPRMRK